MQTSGAARNVVYVAQRRRGGKKQRARHESQAVSCAQNSSSQHKMAHLLLTNAYQHYVCLMFALNKQELLLQAVKSWAGFATSTNGVALSGDQVQYLTQPCKTVGMPSSAH